VIAFQANELPEDRRPWVLSSPGTIRRRLRLIGKHLVGSLFGRRRNPVGANALAAAMVERFGEVLDERELASFFGEERHAPALPVDREDRPPRRPATRG
jgi:hypothetical protein